MSLAVVILAAGQGTRMRSSKAKVLHQIAGKPLLQHVVDTAKMLNPEQIIAVVGHQSDSVRATILSPDLEWVEQQKQLGTGHALLMAIPNIKADSVIVLYGDVPLITIDTLNLVVTGLDKDILNLLTVNLENPKGYGRIVRNVQGAIERIVEEKDASDEDRLISEGNTGILAGRTSDLKKYLSLLDQNNAQGEFYLTDCIEHCIKSGGTVNSVITGNIDEVSGVNNKLQLNQLERAHQLVSARKLMEHGATLSDANRVDVRGSLSVGEDCLIDINCLFTGESSLGNNVSIGANSIIINSVIGDNVEILPHSMVENSVIGSGSVVGPYARIRPDTVLEVNTKVGNFVEIKKSTVGKGSKVNHLSYVGDAVIGENVNVGAGTITCNYDGANKHVTTIEDGAFIGSNTALVAPVTVGKNATVGAGSTLSRDAAAESLTLTRAKQSSIANWKRPVKGK